MPLIGHATTGGGGGRTLVVSAILQTNPTLAVQGGGVKGVKSEPIKSRVTLRPREGDLSDLSDFVPYAEARCHPLGLSPIVILFVVVVVSAAVEAEVAVAIPIGMIRAKTSSWQPRVPNDDNGPTPIWPWH